jgi:signal transduction histidine kinase
LYKEIVARIGSYAGHYKDLSDLLHFVEERTTFALGLRGLRIFVNSPSVEPGSWQKAVLDESRRHDWQPVEDHPLLAVEGFKLAYPLRREDKVEGLLALDAAAASLTPDVRSIIGLLADQVAIAIDDSRLFEENLRLERELAERERLASLGRMAATVAHEIKNPLSAIKSIAQVLREDENLQHQYERDLGLIIGETDRLSQSVTQLLSFARKESAAGQPLSVDEVVRSVADLFRANAREQGIVIDCEVRIEIELEGKSVSAVRDALSNLVLNALQATPPGGKVELIAALSHGELLISVRDSGAGVPVDLRERIWEPFFTTRQRGTGLGLAIVRKRVQEVGGSATLDAGGNGKGAVFLLRLPL